MRQTSPSSTTFPPPPQNEYITVRIDDCEPCHVQPPKRIDPKEIRNLEKIVTKTRQIMPIEVVHNPDYGLRRGAKPFIIANGTRRWKVAQRLKFPYVDAVVIHGQTPTIAWLDRNSGARPVTGIELFYAWSSCETPLLRAEALAAMGSANIRDQIREFVSILGEDLARTYGRMQKFAPSMARTATRFAHLSDNPTVSTQAVTAREALLWMLTHGTKRLVDDILRHENTNQTIVQSAVKFIRTDEACVWSTKANGSKILAKKTPTPTTPATVPLVGVASRTTARARRRTAS